MSFKKHHYCNFLKNIEKREHLMNSYLNRSSSKFKFSILTVLGLVFTFKTRKILFVEHVLKKYRI